MKNLKYFLLLLAGCFNLAYSQKKYGDSLRILTYQELEDKFYSYNDRNEINHSRIIAEQYLIKAKKAKTDKKHLAEAYLLNHYNKKLSVALKYIDSLEMMSKDLSDDRYPARIYLLKGFQYYNADNLKLALENFVAALRHAKDKKNRRQIAIADLQIAYLNGYIGKHRETVKVLQHYYKNTELLSKQDIENIRMNLADRYLDIKEYDKSLNLIKEGLNEAQNSGENIRYHKYLNLLGCYYLKTGKFQEAIMNLEKCKIFFIENKLDFDASYALLYLGDAYASLDDKEQAAENFIKIDLIIERTSNTFPELREVYTYLIDYYKERKDKEKQLYYIDRFLRIDSVLDSQFRYISQEIPNKYDTPKLLSEKEEIIADLTKKRLFSYAAIGILISMLVTLLYLFIKSKRKEHKYKKIAQDLIKSVNESDTYKNNMETAFPAQIPVYDYEKNKLSAEITNNILQGLKTFEQKEQFLRRGISLSGLAKKMKTNSTYLSQVVNTYKEKNFAIYLNDLRIDYALNKLVRDKKFRSYKLSVIAEELGYNNEQAFSIAFKKRTGTTLTIYLKEIENNVALDQ